MTGGENLDGVIYVIGVVVSLLFVAFCVRRWG